MSQQTKWNLLIVFILLITDLSTAVHPSGVHRFSVECLFAVIRLHQAGHEECFQDVFIQALNITMDFFFGKSLITIHPSQNRGRVQVS